MMTNMRRGPRPPRDTQQNVGEGRGCGVVPYYVDIGAGDSDLTWQGMVGRAYAFSWGDVGVAGRYLDYELPSDSPISHLDLSGPALDVAFRW